MVQHRFFIVHEKDARGKKVCFCPLNGPAKWKCNEKNADMGKMSEKLRIFQPSKIRKGECRSNCKTCFAIWFCRAVYSNLHKLFRNILHKQLLIKQFKSWVFRNKGRIEHFPFFH